MDVCQSVFASFFVRAAVGQYDLGQPAQLLRLLTAMARNKLVNEMRRRRRDLASRDSNLASLASAEAAQADKQVAARDLLEVFRSRLSPDERALADRRAAALEWQDIARELGGTAEGLRKRFARAVDRVARELQMDEAANE